MKRLNHLLYSLLIIAGFFCSCATESKNRGKALAFFAEHPAELATLCSNTYPVQATQGKDSVVHDTTYLPGDSVPCPPVTTTDSTGKQTTKTQYVQCPPAKVIREEHYRVDTVPDVAKIKALEAEILDVKTQLAASKAETKIAKDGQETAERKATSRLWLLIAAGGIVAAGAFLKFRGII